MAVPTKEYDDVICKDNVIIDTMSTFKSATQMFMTGHLELPNIHSILESGKYALFTV